MVLRKINIYVIIITRTLKIKEMKTVYSNLFNVLFEKIIFGLGKLFYILSWLLPIMVIIISLVYLFYILLNFITT